MAASPARAERSRTGTAAVAGSARISRSSANPSSSGIITSLITRSGGERQTADERRMPVRDGLHPISGGGEQSTEIVPHVGIVVGDQDPGATTVPGLCPCRCPQSLGLGRQDLIVRRQPAQRLLDISRRSDGRDASERAAPMRSAGRCAAPSGIDTTKALPPPNSLSTRTDPPCSFASSWTSASPMPEPS